MGLIKAALGSVSTVLGDQWREYFYCNSLSDDILMTKGHKRVSGKSSNTKAAENVITNGSVIAVNEGQCMMIVDQGQIVEFAAEAGEYTWDASSESTIFYGDLGQGIAGSWETFKRRFTFGGDTGKDQRVYFFNLKEIVGNKFGTPSPVPFRVVDHNIGLDVDISIRCNGIYSYKIADPILFYKNVCGNVQESYSRQTLDAQLRSEFISGLQPAFAKLSAAGIRYSALPAHTEDICAAMNDALSAKWKAMRGIAVASVAINAVNASAEDEAMIKELQKSAVFRNSNMAAAHMVQAQAEAMKTAAANENGAMMGFMGMNMAQTAGGLNANALYQMGQQEQPANSWTCSCGTVNTGKFCTNCGAANGWACPNCGQMNKGKFCYECGTKKPEGAVQYACDKCGWEPEDPQNPPKFCPECGDRFDSNDIK